MITCKNCSNEFTGHYCNNCGQPADTRRIDHHFVFREIRKTFIRILDDGLFYTTKELFLQPGTAIIRYLDGKRIKHFNPFSYLIFIGGLYLVLIQYFHISILTSDDPLLGNETNNRFMYLHYTQIQILILPLYSLFSILFFGLRTYNFYEFLIINTYLTGQRLVLAICITLPLLVLTRDTPYAHTAMLFGIIPSQVIYIWSYCQLFHEKNTFVVIVKTILVEALTVFIAALILGLFLVHNK